MQYGNVHLTTFFTKKASNTSTYLLHTFSTFIKAHFQEIQMLREVQFYVKLG